MWAGYVFCSCASLWRCPPLSRWRLVQIHFCAVLCPAAYLQLARLILLSFSLNLCRAKQCFFHVEQEQDNSFLLQPRARPPTDFTCLYVWMYLDIFLFNYDHISSQRRPPESQNPIPNYTGVQAFCDILSGCQISPPILLRPNSPGPNQVSLV